MSGNVLLVLSGSALICSCAQKGGPRRAPSRILPAGRAPSASEHRLTSYDTLS